MFLRLNSLCRLHWSSFVVALKTIITCTKPGRIWLRMVMTKEDRKRMSQSCVISSSWVTAETFNPSLLLFAFPKPVQSSISMVFHSGRTMPWAQSHWDYIYITSENWQYLPVIWVTLSVVTTLTLYTLLIFMRSHTCSQCIEFWFVWSVVNVLVDFLSLQAYFL